MHTNGISNNNTTNHTRPALDILDSPGIKRRSRHAAKLNMGDTKDDIHVCIMCLRAIMNNKVSCHRFILKEEYRGPRFQFKLMFS